MDAKQKISTLPTHIWRISPFLGFHSEIQCVLKPLLSISSVLRLILGGLNQLQLNPTDPTHESCYTSSSLREIYSAWSKPSSFNFLRRLLDCSFIKISTIHWMWNRKGLLLKRDWGFKRWKSYFPRNRRWEIQRKTSTWLTSWFNIKARHFRCQTRWGKNLAKPQWRNQVI